MEWKVLIHGLFINFVGVYQNNILLFEIVVEFDCKTGEVEIIFECVDIGTHI